MSKVNPIKRKFVSADPDKCVGCGVCEYACSSEKEKVYNPIKSRIRVVRLNPLDNSSPFTKRRESQCKAKSSATRIPFKKRPLLTMF